MIFFIYLLLFLINKINNLLTLTLTNSNFSLIHREELKQALLVVVLVV